MTKEEYIEESARITLNISFYELAQWCLREAEGDLDVETMLLMLKRQVHQAEKYVQGSIKSALKTYPSYKENPNKESY